MNSTRSIIHVALLAFAVMLADAASCAPFQQHRLCQGQEDPRNGDVSPVSVILNLGSASAYTKAACQVECLKQLARAGDGCCQMKPYSEAGVVMKSPWCRWIPNAKALSTHNYRKAPFQRAHFGALCVQT